MKSDWTKHLEDELIRYLKEGLSYREIAEKLNRTGDSVRLKSNRLGYKSEDFKKYLQTFCLNCSKTYKGDKGSKFCSKSCSVCYNNKLRKHSILTKSKISQSLKGNRNNYNETKRRCNDCEITIAKNNKSGKCRKCLNKDPEYKLRFKQALKGKVGGYRVKGGNPHHKGSYYEGVWMDSSWELLLAKRLNFLNIKWERGSKIWLPWVDDLNAQHKYYPDFFLSDFNIYVEIKGFWLDKVKIKMQKVKEQNIINLITLESIKDITNFKL